MNRLSFCFVGRMFKISNIYICQRFIMLVGRQTLSSSAVLGDFFSFNSSDKVGIPHGDEIMGKWWAIWCFIAEVYQTNCHHVVEQ